MQENIHFSSFMTVKKGSPIAKKYFFYSFIQNSLETYFRSFQVPLPTCILLFNHYRKLSTKPIHIIIQKGIVQCYLYQQKFSDCSTFQNKLTLSMVSSSLTSYTMQITSAYKRTQITLRETGLISLFFTCF